MDVSPNKIPGSGDTHGPDFHGSNQFRSAKFVSVLYPFLRPVMGFIPVLVIVFFFGALFWANLQDPFSRNWFTLSTTTGGLFKCVAVLPKPVRQCPVVIYVHGSSGTLINDGNDLRQMAEMGLAVVGIEYDQTNEIAFMSQFESLLQYLARQKWADTNAIAWVGFSMGAIRTFDFALQHPEQQPQLLIQLSGGGLGSSSIPHPPFPVLNCRVLLIHGGLDKIFPLDDTRRQAAALQTNGVPVDLEVLPGSPHDVGPERGVVFRNIGEYCLAHFQKSSNRRDVQINKTGTTPATLAAESGWWQNYHSIAQWQAETPPFWLFCLPAVVWVIGWCVWKYKTTPFATAERKLQRSEIALRWLAAVLATWALAETAIHLVTPHFPVSHKTLSIARKMLVQDKECADFETLAGRPIWQGQKLKTLLDHVELAGYNRELVTWQLDDKIYRDQVLSPVITGDADEQPSWRRQLWEEFYPRIRHESSPEDAARIVVRHLRERVTVVDQPDLPHSIPEIWLRQLASPVGFEITYIAALRSVGIPARLDGNGKAEMYDGRKWLSAPRPVIFDSFQPASQKEPL